MKSYREDLESDGFAIVPDVLDASTIDRLRDHLADIRADEATSRRGGKAFGVRNLLNVIPATRELAISRALRLLIEPVLGSGARVVRGVYFDKHKDANWKVAWHQDLTIAVRERVDIDEYGPWSLKAGIHHVQPPMSVLQGMLAARIHLDDTDASNGALRVFPGSQKHGRLTRVDIERWKANHK